MLSLSTSHSRRLQTRERVRLGVEDIDEADWFRPVPMPGPAGANSRGQNRLLVLAGRPVLWTDLEQGDVALAAGGVPLRRQD